jgi:hypothetical protein
MVVRIVHVLTVPLIVHFYYIYSYIPISSAYCSCYIHIVCVCGVYVCGVYVCVCEF